MHYPTHGLSKEQRASLTGRYAKCPLCKRKFLKGLPARLDHDHQTGAPRGVVCHDCNIALGWIRDNPATAERMARYLREGNPFQDLGG